jgi:hypothetical protein
VTIVFRVKIVDGRLAGIGQDYGPPRLGKTILTIMSWGCGHVPILCIVVMWWCCVSSGALGDLQWGS